MSVICESCSGNFDEAKLVNNQCPLCGYPDGFSGHVVHFVAQGGRRWLRVMIYTILFFILFILLSGFMNNPLFFKIGIILSPILSFFIAGRKTKKIFKLRTDDSSL